MKYIYSTKMEGIEYTCIAKTIDNDIKIVVTRKINAPCRREAAEIFEEYLLEICEGFDWLITILSKTEQLKQ